jgi:hypothetical protein
MRLCFCKCYMQINAYTVSIWYITLLGRRSATVPRLTSRLASRQRQYAQHEAADTLDVQKPIVSALPSSLSTDLQIYTDI